MKKRDYKVVGTGSILAVTFTQLPFLRFRPKICYDFLRIGACATRVHLAQIYESSLWARPPWETFTGHDDELRTNTNTAGYDVSHQKVEQVCLIENLCTI